MDKEYVGLVYDENKFIKIFESYAGAILLLRMFYAYRTRKKDVDVNVNNINGVIVYKLENKLVSVFNKVNDKITYTQAVSALEKYLLTLEDENVDYCALCFAKDVLKRRSHLKVLLDKDNKKLAITIVDINNLQSSKLHEHVLLFKLLTCSNIKEIDCKEYPHLFMLQERMKLLLNYDV